jgi:hypothetical protein
MWVAIHMCLEATLGISLYSYPFLKLAKRRCLSYYLLCFLFNKNREQEGGTSSPGKGRGRRGEMDWTIYIHVNKCKNDKIKERKKYQLVNMD